MFRNLRKKIKKKYQLEKEVKYKFLFGYLSFVFAFYTLISPNLLIFLKKKLHIRVDLNEAL